MIHLTYFSVRRLNILARQNEKNKEKIRLFPRRVVVCSIRRKSVTKVLCISSSSYSQFAEMLCRVKNIKSLEKSVKLQLNTEILFS